MTKTIKHLFLICILVIIPNGCHRQSSEQNVAAENDCTDIVPLMRPAKSKTAAYLDSLGFINIAEADSSIGIDLMYTRANNFTGQVLYEDLHEAYLHPEALKSLLQAQKRLERNNAPVTVLLSMTQRARCLSTKNVEQRKRNSPIYIRIQSCARRWPAQLRYGCRHQHCRCTRAATSNGYSRRLSWQGGTHHRRRTIGTNRQAHYTRTGEPPALAQGDERSRFPHASQ